jgi:hypothetical protein
VKGYSNIGLGIGLLVNVTTATGKIQIIGSCNGQWHILGATPPYSNFKCSEDVALRLANALANDGHGTNSLNYDWELIGLFHSGQGLCFHLTFTGRWFNRRRVERDIVFLSDLFARVV